MFSWNFVQKNSTVLIIFVVLVTIIYGASLSGDFVYDDREILNNREMLSTPQGLSQAVLTPFWTPESGLYRPVTVLSYAFNFMTLGNSSFGFHFINILLYISICLFIYLLIKKLFENEVIAFAVALIFLVLPIHTEVVANITGRSELLALMFSLLALLEMAQIKPKFWLLGIWTLLSIGSKETGLATLPLVLLVMFIKERSLTINVLKKYFRELASMVIAIEFYLVLRFFSLGSANFLGVKTTIIENPLMFTDMWSRIATAFKVLSMYVSKMIFPINLCSDYSFNQIPIIHNLSDIGAVFGLLIFLSSIFLVVFYLNKKPLISFGLSIFIFSFLPVSNIFFPTGTIAGERLFFYPSFGFSIIFGYLLYKTIIIFKKENARKIILTVFWIIIVIYTIRSTQRQSVWLTEERLFTSASICAPKSVIARSNMGAIYLLRGNLEKAEEELIYAMNIRPTYSKGINNLGLVYFKQGNLAKARELYLEALRQEFPYQGAAENLSALHLAQDNYEMARHWLLYLYPNNTKDVDEFLINYKSQNIK